MTLNLERGSLYRMRERPIMLTNLELPEYFLNTPSSAVSELKKIGLLNQLLKTRAVQRLKNVRFLGAIEYISATNQATEHRKSSRYDHTISVTHLAKYYVDQKNFDTQTKLEILAAALLHDIGHPPLSHSMESAFKRKFGKNHHDTTREIILGQIPLGVEINSILHEFDLDPEVVFNIIDKRIKSEATKIFWSDFNIDTIEGIYRTCKFTGLFRTVKTPNILVNDIHIQNNNSTESQDRFWETKNSIYKLLIQGPAGQLAYKICDVYCDVFDEKLTITDMYVSDSELWARHRILFSIFYKIKKESWNIFRCRDDSASYYELNDYISRVIERQYYINRSNLDSPPSLKLRWQVAKREKFTSVGPLLQNFRGLLENAHESGSRKSLNKTANDKKAPRLFEDENRANKRHA